MLSISEEDIRNNCWYCGKPVRGFDKTLGRDIKSYKGHYCNTECYEKANEILDQVKIQ